MKSHLVFCTMKPCGTFREAHHQLRLALMSACRKRCTSSLTRMNASRTVRSCTGPTQTRVSANLVQPSVPLASVLPLTIVFLARVVFSTSTSAFPNVLMVISRTTTLKSACRALPNVAHVTLPRVTAHCAVMAFHLTPPPVNAFQFWANRQIQLNAMKAVKYAKDKCEMTAFCAVLTLSYWMEYVSTKAVLMAFTWRKRNVLRK